MPETAPRSYTGRVVAAVAILAVAWIAWQLLHVVIIAFGAVLVASVLHGLAAPLRHRFGLPQRVALALTLLALLVLGALAALLLGERVASQIEALREAIPQALGQAMRWLQGNPIGRTLLEVWDNAKEDGMAFAQVARLATMTLGALGSALLIVVTGIYLAADTGLYRRGVLRLLPEAQRPRVEEALQAAGVGLQRWLKGQAVSMLAIGTLTAGGLLLLGMPMALTLGAITGLLAFVPFFGAVTAGALVVLLAFTQGPQMALSAALLFIAIQQAEELLILPFVQRWAVRLPPALGLLSVLIFSLLFGPLGALFATPLMVVAMILVQKLYVHGVIENGTAPAHPALAKPR